MNRSVFSPSKALLAFLAMIAAVSFLYFGASSSLPDRVELAVVYIPQNDTKSCATTCMAMVISHYEKLAEPLDKEEVWRLSGADEQAVLSTGNDMDSLKKVADVYGYQSEFLHGMKVSDIERFLSQGIPLILNVQWRKGSPQTHALLAIGYDRRRQVLFIHDPAAREKRELPYSELEDRWSAHLSAPFGLFYHSAFVVYPKGK